MFRLIAAAIVCCVMTGCGAIKPMAFDKTTKVIDTKDKSIILMTLEVSRADESRFVPEPFNMFFETPTAKTSEDRSIFHLSNSDDSVQDNGKTVYLARLALVGGEYKLQTISGMARAFPITGFFNIPLGMDVAVKPNAVTYLGRVKAQMRRRESGEFRAGPVVPLIDQAIAGMVRSTWEVAVVDNTEHDLALFRAAYPILKDIVIDTGSIPKFDRAVAQRMWEGTNGKPDDAAPAPAATAAPAALAAPAAPQ